jgi:Amt family ammonium transporter
MHAMVAALLTLGLAVPAAAQLDAAVVPDSGDTAWLLASLLIGAPAAVIGLLIYLIGSNGRVFAGRTVTAVVAGLALTTLLYLLIGYSLMFDGTPNLPIGAFLGGGANWMLNLMGTVRDGTTVPETGFALFQLGFVWIAVTLLSAALAHRARTGWLLGFTGLWFLLVLVPVTRWLWGGGWLADWGALDVAGGLTIFYCAAVSAMIALMLIGAPRDSDAPPPDDHLRLAGAALLLVGVTAMAGGATLGAGDNAAVAMLATITSAASGALLLALLRRGVEPGHLAGGLVAGTLAAASAGDGISIGGAVLTGALAAAAWHITPFVARRIWHDRGATIASMAGAAKTGAFVFAIFLAFTPFGGSGYAEGMGMGRQLLAQTVAICAIAGWSVIGTAIAALMTGLVLPMRPDAGGKADE